MTAGTETPAALRLDRERLMALADGAREAYAAAGPFPHVVLDDFLPEAALDAVLAEFPGPAQADWLAYASPLERKLATKDDAALGPMTRQALAEFNSATFIDFLERLTGIDGLVPDPHLVGGGLHQIERGGHLGVHADFNRHPRTGLERRLNVLVYLNRGWKEEYGGALELWNADMSACEARILPLFNRCVVFSTTSTSFHGHPEPLACPEGETRKSIALYYYSKDRPAHERRDAHNTLWAPPPAPRRRARLRAAVRAVTPPILLDVLHRRRG